MLVLGRRKGEVVEISAYGQTIRVTVVSISGSYVRLGIDAPAPCAIRRAELADKPGGNPGTNPKQPQQQENTRS
jgi:carbon storage regulator CsrA